MFIRDIVQFQSVQRQFTKRLTVDVGVGSSK